MAPSTPVRETLLSDIVSYLDAVTAGATYFTTLTGKVFRVVHSDPKLFPCCYVLPLEEELSENAGNAPFMLTESRLSVVVEMRTLEQTPQAPLVMEQLIHDVKKALLITDARRTHSGAAIDTLIERVTPPSIAEATTPFLWCAMYLTVRYRYRSADPSTTG